MIRRNFLKSVLAFAVLPFVPILAPVYSRTITLGSSWIWCPYIPVTVTCIKPSGVIELISGWPGYPAYSNVYMRQFGPNYDKT